MTKGWKSQDAQAALEAERYENPIPSRLFIIEYLEERGAPATHAVMCKELGIKEEEQKDALQFRLKAMIRDGQILQNRKDAFAPMSKLQLIKGRVAGHKEGYGFLIPDDGGEDLHLDAREMRQLFDGDRAVVREIGVDHRGRKEGQLIEVIERNTSQLVGRFYTESGAAFVIPESNKINREVIVQPGPLVPTDGQYVLIEITQQPEKRTMPMGIIKEILGDQFDEGMEVEVAVRTHNIPHEWPDAVKAQVKSFSTEVAESDKAFRVDLRNKPFVTIDGEDARDFDDAVYCEAKTGGGWRLYVAIADVSHYVKPNSALDEEAVNRGTSVYFPGHVIPMLPEVLSNGLCSLNPHVDRLAMVCEMTISAKGKISGYKFYEGLINSHARLTYTKVWQMLNGSDDGKIMRDEYSHVVNYVDQLYKLYNVLIEVRHERGTIDFETVETRIIFGRNRKIEQIVPTERNDAHKLIEECMLCANVCAAKFLEKHEIPGLYRVHEGPTLEKKLNLNSFLKSLALAVPTGKITPKVFQQLLASVKDRPDFSVIQTVVLRSMSQAVYSPDNQGHFGLAFPAYAHFTSPIRRYPDLMVHRAIRHVVRSGIASKHVERVGANPIDVRRIYPYNLADIQQLGEHCSATERRADLATRDAMDWLKCEYMQQHIGQQFSGTVSAVTGFGLFVALDEVFVEGLVHITNLPDDYYAFDNTKLCLRGEHTGKKYGLGDKLEIIVSRVDLDDKKIDFELVDASSASSSKKPSKSKSPKKGGAKGSDGFGSRFKSEAAKAKLLREAKAAEERAKTGKPVRTRHAKPEATAEEEAKRGHKKAKKAKLKKAVKKGKKKAAAKLAKAKSADKPANSTLRKPRKRPVK